MAIIDPASYGCAGDGTTNDATNFQTALNAAASGTLDGAGRTYKINSTLSLPSDVVLQNCKFDFSGFSGGGNYIQCVGSLGSTVSLSGTAARAAPSFVASSVSGLAAGDWLFLSSGTDFGTGNSENSEWVEIYALDGTTVRPYRRLQDNYTSSPQFQKATFKRNIILRNVGVKGSLGSNTFGLYFEVCRDVVLENVHSETVGGQHAHFERCLDARVIGGSFAHATPAQGAYGVAVANGCERVSITGASFHDLRHGVTIGAEHGVDRYVTVQGCKTTACRDAGIDCHPAAQYVTISGNSIGTGSTVQSYDGIVVQCANATITNNVVQGFARNGILYQPATLQSDLYDDHPIISGNQVSRPGAVQSGAAQAGASTTITLSTGASPEDDAYTGFSIRITAGTGSGQTKTINDYVGSTKVATVTSWSPAPDATSTYEVFDTVYGIVLQNYTRAASAMRFAIVGNTVDVLPATGSYGMYVEGLSTASHIAGGLISGNNVTSQKTALTLKSGTGIGMRSIAVTGCSLECASASDDCVYIEAASTPNYLERVILSGNSLYGGRYGINNNQGTRIKADANMIQAFVTAATNGSFVGSNDNYTS